MGANQSSTSDEDSCSSDTDDKIVEPPKEIRKLAIEEPPATAVAPPPSVEGNIAHHLSHTSSSDIEVTRLTVKIPKLDEETTPWKGSLSKLTSRQQSSAASSANEEEQVSIIIIIIPYFNVSDQSDCSKRGDLFHLLHLPVHLLHLQIHLSHRRMDPL